MEASSPKHAPGWYEFHGGQRFWDGERWTDHMAPPRSLPAEPMGFAKTVLAVAVGVVLAWGLIYAGSEVAPDDIYVPVKFVTEDVPNLVK
jgi:Protein of unknown function (DUF2510)